jgi:hypothetical protein
MTRPSKRAIAYRVGKLHKMIMDPVKGRGPYCNQRYTPKGLVLDWEHVTCGRCLLARATKGTKRPGP